MPPPINRPASVPHRAGTVVAQNSPTDKAGAQTPDNKSTPTNDPKASRGNTPAGAANAGARSEQVRNEVREHRRGINTAKFAGAATQALERADRFDGKKHEMVRTKPALEAYAQKLAQEVQSNPDVNVKDQVARLRLREEALKVAADRSLSTKGVSNQIDESEQKAGADPGRRELTDFEKEAIKHVAGEVNAVTGDRFKKDLDLLVQDDRGYRGEHLGVTDEAARKVMLFAGAVDDARSARRDGSDVTPPSTSGTAAEYARSLSADQSLRQLDHELARYSNRAGLDFVQIAGDLRQNGTLDHKSRVAAIDKTYDALVQKDPGLAGEFADILAESSYETGANFGQEALKPFAETGIAASKETAKHYNRWVNAESLGNNPGASAPTPTNASTPRQPAQVQNNQSAEVPANVANFYADAYRIIDQEAKLDANRPDSAKIEPVLRERANKIAASVQDSKVTEATALRALLLEDLAMKAGATANMTPRQVLDDIQRAASQGTGHGPRSLTQMELEGLQQYVAETDSAHKGAGTDQLAKALQNGTVNQAEADDVLRVIQEKAAEGERQQPSPEHPTT